MDELEESGHDDRHTAASNGRQNFARYMIGGLCLILFLALTGVGYVQVEERRGGGLRPFVSAENKKCIDCHMAKDVGGRRHQRLESQPPCTERHRLCGMSSGRKRRSGRV